MPLRTPDSVHGPFAERNTCLITATVKDELGVAIPGSSLTTMTLTLYDEKSYVAGDTPSGIINSRNKVNIKSLVNGSGVLTLELLPADMVIFTAGKASELHRVLLEWTYAAGAKEGSYEAQISVSAVEKRP